MITRIPDNVLLAKKGIEELVVQLDDVTPVILNNSKGEVKYRVIEKITEYEGIEIKMATCYSETLRETKTKKITKAVEKEINVIEKLVKEFKNRKFACKEDAELEIKKHYQKI